MKIYSYDGNGILTGERERQIDPLESKLQKKTVYCGIPNNTTDIKPPAIVSGKLAVFDGSKWTLNDNILGEHFSTDDGSRVIIEDINADITGLTREPKPDQYHTWVKGEWKFTETTQKADDERRVEVNNIVNEKMRQTAIDELKTDGTITAEDETLIKE